MNNRLRPVSPLFTDPPPRLLKILLILFRRAPSTTAQAKPFEPRAVLPRNTRRIRCHVAFRAMLLTPLSHPFSQSLH